MPCLCVRILRALDLNSSYCFVLISFRPRKSAAPFATVGFAVSTQLENIVRHETSRVPLPPHPREVAVVIADERNERHQPRKALIGVFAKLCTGSRLFGVDGQIIMGCDDKMMVRFHMSYFDYELVKMIQD